MGVEYIERFEILSDSSYGIEDHEDGRPADQHFFGADYPKGRKRFMVWRGGCGFGEFDTLAEARQKVYDYAKERLIRRERELQEELGKVGLSISLLGKDVFNLGEFKVPGRGR